MECKIFLVGVLAGMCIGAVVVANNKKTRQVICDCQEKVKEKAEELTKSYDKMSKEENND